MPEFSLGIKNSVVKYQHEFCTTRVESVSQKPLNLFMEKILSLLKCLKIICGDILHSAFFLMLSGSCHITTAKRSPPVFHHWDLSSMWVWQIKKLQEVKQVSVSGKYQAKVFKYKLPLLTNALFNFNSGGAQQTWWLAGLLMLFLPLDTWTSLY